MKRPGETDEQYRQRLLRGAQSVAQQAFTVPYIAATDPNIRQMPNVWDRLAFAGRQHANQALNDPNRSLAGAALGIMGQAPFSLAGEVGSVVSRPFEQLFLPQSENLRRQTQRSNAAGGRLPQGGGDVEAPLNPFAGLEQLLAGLSNPQGAAGPITQTTTTSGSPEALAMARQAANFALLAGQPQQQEFTMAGPPRPPAPKLAKTDFSAMDRAVEMLNPGEFAEDAERKRLALPTFMRAIAEAGMLSNENTPIGTLLFRMGMGALSARSLMNSEIQELREKHEERHREYARALANGEQQKAIVAAKESNDQMLMQFELELADYKNSTQVLGDGTMMTVVTNPETGEKSVTRYTPADFTRTAQILGSLSSVIASASPRSSTTTMTGRGGEQAPHPVIAAYQKAQTDNIVRRMMIAEGVPPALIAANDVIKHNLFADLGIGDKDLQEIDKRAMRRANSMVGPQAPPAAMTEAYQTARVQEVANLLSGDQAQQRVFRALRARGLEFGSSYVQPR